MIDELMNELEDTGEIEKISFGVDVSTGELIISVYDSFTFKFEYEDAKELAAGILDALEMFKKPAVEA